METTLIDRTFELVQSHSGWLIAMSAVFAFLESVALLGLLLPGVVLLFVIGAVASGDLALFMWCWLAAFFGALGGDWTSYWIGRHYRERIDGWPLLRRHPDLMARVRAAMIRHGGKGVFFGRLLGPTRPVSALVAGAMNLPPRTMLLATIPACAIWVPIYMLPGLLFGASLELAAEFAGRLAVVLVALLLVLWGVVWATRVIYTYTARRSSWWLRSLIRWSSDHPLIGRWVEPLFGTGPGRRELLSVTLLGLFLLGCLSVLLAVIIAAPFAAGTLDAERQLASLATSLRNHVADPVMITIAFAGDLRVLAVVAGTMALLMLALGRGNAAAHWLAATAGGWLLAELLNAWLGFLFPAPGAAPGYGEVPHRGLTLATVLLGFFAVMVAKDLRAVHRKWAYLVNTVLLSLVAFASFYLGLVTPLGLAAALALGGGWLALVGIGYRQRSLPRRHPGMLALLFYGLLVSVTAFQLDGGYQRLADATRLELPRQSISANAWQAGGWQDLPARRSRLGLAESQRFDFQYAGSRAWLVERLADSGWRKPQARSLRWAALLSVRPDPDRLPHLARDFAGKPENLILVRDRDDGRREVLRLWASGTRLQPGDIPVWLGQVRIETVGEVLGLVNRWQDAREPEAALQALENALGDRAEIRPVGEARLRLISRLPRRHPRAD
ncbi:VTT domain-containing protein [Wenzhouxiangella sp. EGI_FJ10409]|uniref:VTT domain-containing protein n=1 Tax=Wenzhouxiangella sp. EGI_FJ10409 TaxID=3243767 RepID=UPI0035E009D9